MKLEFRRTSHHSLPLIPLFRGNSGSSLLGWNALTLVARKPSFSCKQTPAGWKVEIPSSLSASGKRERAFFPNRDKARDFAAGLQEKFRESGSLASAIKPSLAEAAIEAERLLEPTGISLVEAAREVRQRWEAARTSEMFGVAVAQYLDSRQDLRDKTFKSYRYTLERTAKPLAEKRLSDISLAEIQELLAGKASTSARMHRANLSAFWRWAAKPPRNWCDKDLLEGLETPRVSDDSDIEILRPGDVRAILTAAEQENPAAAVAFAIAIFAGVRMAELERLKWGDVNDEKIEIGKAIAKKHSRRLVPISPTLRAWIDAYRGGADNDSLIVPANWTEVSKAVRRLAGWNVSSRQLKDRVAAGKLAAMPPAPRGKWPANAPRHTCASVQVAIGTPLDALIFAFGHSGGHDLLRKHYVSRLTKKEALAILATGPQGSSIDGIQVVREVG